MKRSYAVAGGLAAAAFIAGALWWGHRAEKSPGAIEQVTLADVVEFPGSSLIRLAEAKGYFTEEGVGVKIQPQASGKDALDSVLAGTADLALTLELPVVMAVLKEAPVLIVATIATTGKGWGIVARSDRGIVRPQDLKGKRIGVAFGTAAHFWLDLFLVRNRLAIADVKVTNVPVQKVAEMLAADELDAGVSVEPFLSAAVGALGPGAVTFSADNAYDAPWSLVVRREFVVRRPDAIRKMLRALVRAERFYASDREAALSLVAQGQKTDPARLQRIFRDIQFRVHLGQSLLGTLEDESRWAIRNKLVDSARIPNYLDHIHVDGLLSVAPEAVTILR